MKVIERSERIKALQKLAEATGDVIRGYYRYAKIREGQKNNFKEQEQKNVVITEIKEDDEDNEVRNYKMYSTNLNQLECKLYFEKSG